MTPFFGRRDVAKQRLCSRGLLSAGLDETLWGARSFGKLRAVLSPAMNCEPLKRLERWFGDGGARSLHSLSLACSVALGRDDITTGMGD
jgi:hypothetical protein